MQAWQINDVHDTFEKSMRLTQTSKPPPPKKGQVLIKVLSMALNPADHKLVERWPVVSKLIFGRPLVPGLDFCGRIVQLPAHGAPDDLKPDQLVFGRMDQPSKFGPLAQYALVPISGVVPLPDGLAIDDAAGIGTCALTAHQAIVPYVKKDSQVFINGGSGGTGTFAIQIAKLLGCHVVVSCSSGNAELCKSLGADEIIDYRSVNLSQVLTSRGPIFDLFVDLVGTTHPLHAESVGFLKATGLFVLVAGPDESAAGLRSMLRSWLLPVWLGGVRRRWKFMMVANQREQLAQIARWVEEGKIKTVTDSRYAFEDAQKAFAKLRTGRAKGKIVVEIGKTK